jgi:uncharacterized membrane protein YeaQ/YmgE (transglycosylase-associated protein family)
MDQMALIVTLIVGAIIGWAAAKVLKRTGFGVIGDIIVGMVGGFVGAWVWSFLHQPAESFDVVRTPAASAVGALVLLVLWRMVKR